MPRRSVFAAGLLVLLLLPSCTTLGELAALRRVDFDIDRVADTYLAGIDVDRIRSYEDLRPTDVGRLAGAVSRGELPLRFTLHLGAENPENNPQARLIRLDWTLLLDGTETISGVFDDERVLPPGRVTDIPITMELDLVRFFGRNLEELIDLALAVAGEGEQEVALRARPTIRTPLGPITYPGELTILRRRVGGA